MRGGWVGLVLVQRVGHYPDHGHLIFRHAQQGLLELLQHRQQERMRANHIAIQKQRALYTSLGA